MQNKKSYSLEEIREVCKTYNKDTNYTEVFLALVSLQHEKKERVEKIEVEIQK